MPITDYIPAQTLVNEGWLRADDQQGMFDNIDKHYLAERGYVCAERLANVRVSVNKAAELVGVSPSTLATYITTGYIAVDADGKISMLDAISFDYTAAKRAELAKKRRMRNDL